jgi:hypothetical protein
MSLWVSAGDTATQIMDAGLNSTFDGNVYAKSAKILVNSGAKIIIQGQLVCNELYVDSGSSITIDSGNGVSNGPKVVALVE